MEQELKLALRRPSELGRLLETLPEPREVIRQANHYLVCVDDRTLRAAVMVRLRIEEREGNATACLTLKRRLRANEGVFLSWELEEAVPIQDARAVTESGAELMSLANPCTLWLARELEVQALRVQGTLLNVRHVVEYEGFILEVDRSEFPDGSVDVEIEVETEDPEGARRALTDLTDRVGIALFQQNTGKYTRYLKRGGQR